MPDHAKIPDVGSDDTAQPVAVAHDASDYVSEESIGFAVAHMDESEVREFMAGFGKRMQEVHRTSAPAAISLLFQYVDEWVVSINLRENPDWQQQIRATDDESADQQIVDVEGLKQLLRR